LGDDIASCIGRSVINLAGKTNLHESAALLKKSNLLVGNDGGAMHLGDAVGCKVLSLVPGIEYPQSVEPWFNRKNAIRLSVPCAPCYSFTCCPLGHNKCMKDIKVDIVFDKSKEILMNLKR
jgi:ADP-heptose:LPS heptosyltransferase